MIRIDVSAEGAGYLVRVYETRRDDQASEHSHAENHCHAYAYPQKAASLKEERQDVFRAILAATSSWSHQEFVAAAGEREPLF